MKTKSITVRTRIYDKLKGSFEFSVIRMSFSVPEKINILLKV